MSAPFPIPYLTKAYKLCYSTPSESVARKQERGAKLQLHKQVEEATKKIARGTKTGLAFKAVGAFQGEQYPLGFTSHVLTQMLTRRKIAYDHTARRPLFRVIQ